MTWNYRVVKTAEGFSVFEVFYDEAGQPTGVTERPTLDIFCETGDDVLAELKIIKAAWDLPCLEMEGIVKANKT